jgi:hypothetical protein
MGQDCCLPSQNICILPWGIRQHVWDRATQWCDRVCFSLYFFLWSLSKDRVDDVNSLIGNNGNLLLKDSMIEVEEHYKNHFKLSRAVWHVYSVVHVSNSLQIAPWSQILIKFCLIPLDTTSAPISSDTYWSYKI